MRLKAVFLLTLCLLNYNNSFSQKKIRPTRFPYPDFYKKNSLAISIDANTYQGDLSPYSTGGISTTQLGGSAYYLRELTAFLQLKGSLGIGYFAADEAKYKDVDPWRGDRAFSVHTFFTDAYIEARFNILNLGNDCNNRFSPYISTGVGAIFLRPKINSERYDSSGFSPTVNQTIQEGLITDKQKKNRFAFSIPVGVGCEYELQPGRRLFISYQWYIVYSDYLDGYSESNLSSLRDGYSRLSVGYLIKL